MELPESLPKPEDQDQVVADADPTSADVSRRKFGAKLVYVPPAVLAVIDATKRPALAASCDPATNPGCLPT
jgi:hypothetical protein